MTSSKPRRLSPQMRKVLETVSVYEEIIGRGTTAGVVSAGGGSPGVLYSAVKKGWVLPYLDSNNDDGDRAPHYWRTNEGTRVLAVDTELYGPPPPTPDPEDDDVVDPDVVDELYRLAAEASVFLRSGVHLRAAEVFDRARALAESAGAPEETVDYFAAQAKDARDGHVEGAPNVLSSPVNPGPGGGIRQLTLRVSAVLRAAGLPVLRYDDKVGGRGRSGIRVGNPDAAMGTCCVFFHADDDDEEVEREYSDLALAVLVANGFEVDRTPGDSLLVVRNRRGVSEVEDANAVAAASGLAIVQPTRNEWHVAVDGKRAVYVIKRSGSGARMRYAVQGRGWGAPPKKNLRTMSAAINVIKGDMSAGKS